jgi:hypothetical protein
MVREETNDRWMASDHVPAINVGVLFRKPDLERKARRKIVQSKQKVVVQEWNIKAIECKRVSGLREREREREGGAKVKKNKRGDDRGSAV